ncbi:MAG: putative toxin-antitoxin system toxin component, PIN family [Elusimicrobia bacterium CG_4_9_14_3_um_filter_62_55]|nr:MAG: putative toxin-antitoxin system toxin component, PIN family [Elusimicrobia bacterium CG22_combo_CG10-13_8_21_14_all_63_91]PJB24298.1 MAG: putative toxin-antitoxin system toxin component, PIN family [Elusimicrobia bacterium CG_4_9_14_3_um_filter_62_55]
MRIVLDTNILVSAAISSRGNAAKILELVADGALHLSISEPILSELAEVLARPKIGFSAEKIRVAIEAIGEISELVYPEITVDAIKTHESDNRILVCAVEAKADKLLTGDLKDIRPLGSFHGFA